MKVGIIHPYFDVIGGAEMTSMSLIDILNKNKIKTRIFCVKKPKISETNFLQIFQVKQKNFPLFWKYQRIMEIKKIFNAISENRIMRFNATIPTISFAAFIFSFLVGILKLKNFILFCYHKIFP